MLLGHLYFFRETLNKAFPAPLYSLWLVELSKPQALSLDELLLIRYNERKPERLKTGCWTQTKRWTRKTRWLRQCLANVVIKFAQIVQSEDVRSRDNPYNLVWIGMGRSKCALFTDTTWVLLALMSLQKGGAIWWYVKREFEKILICFSDKKVTLINLCFKGNIGSTIRIL